MDILMRNGAVTPYLGFATKWRRDKINSKNEVPEACDEWVELLSLKEMKVFHITECKRDRDLLEYFKSIDDNLARMAKVVANGRYEFASIGIDPLSKGANLIERLSV